MKVYVFSRSGRYMNLMFSNAYKQRILGFYERQKSGTKWNETAMK